MYKNCFKGLLIICFSLSGLQVVAQSPTIKWGAGIGGGVIQYVQKAKGPDFQYSFYDPVIQISGSRYLAGAFDFHTEFTYGPKVQFPVSVEQTRPSALFDMNYQLRFKINNGLFLKETSFIAPYLSFGIGGSYTENNPDAYVPLGGGIRFRLSKRASINVQSIRKFSLNKDYQNLAHVISFVYNLGKEQIPSSPQVPEELSDEQVLATVEAADDDGDGIPNLQDRCPDLPGLLIHLGCPEPETEKTEIISPSTHEGETQTPVIADINKTEEPQPVEMESDLPATPEPDTPELQSQPLQIENISLVESGPCSQNVLENIPSVLFMLNSDHLDEEAKAALDQIAEMMKGCPASRLLVEGHTDALGTNNRNMVLSVMRAYRVKYYLVYEHGISQMRITSGGLGEDQPIASNDTSEGREQNRRVNFRLSF